MRDQIFFKFFPRLLEFTVQSNYNTAKYLQKWSMEKACKVCVLFIGKPLWQYFPCKLALCFLIHDNQRLYSSLGRSQSSTPYTLRSNPMERSLFFSFFHTFHAFWSKNKHQNTKILWKLSRNMRTIVIFLFEHRFMHFGVGIYSKTQKSCCSCTGNYRKMHLKTPYTCQISIQTQSKTTHFATKQYFS